MATRRHRHRPCRRRRKRLLNFYSPPEDPTDYIPTQGAPAAPQLRRRRRHLRRCAAVSGAFICDIESTTIASAEQNDSSPLAGVARIIGPSSSSSRRPTGRPARPFVWPIESIDVLACRRVHIAYTENSDSEVVFIRFFLISGKPR